MLGESPSAFSSDLTTARAETLDSIAARIKATDEHFVVGAFVGNGRTLVGTAGGARERGQKRQHIGTVSGMFVHPDHRGRGIANALLTHAVSSLFALPGIDQIELGVTAGNAAAHTLYLRHGFIEYGREPRALRIDGRDHDEILMVKWRTTPGGSA
jgi:ribosomal protein S18 acetylase RimI-like enzyme